MTQIITDWARDTTIQHKTLYKTQTKELCMAHLPEVGLRYIVYNWQGVGRNISGTPEGFNQAVEYYNKLD